MISVSELKKGPWPRERDRRWGERQRRDRETGDRERDTTESSSLHEANLLLEEVNR